MKLTAFALIALLVLTGLPAAGQYSFDGGPSGTGEDIFAEENWFDSALAGDPANGSFDPSTAVPTHPVDARLIIGGTSAATFDENFDLGANVLQVCNDATLTRISNQGIRANFGGAKGSAEVKDNAGVHLRFSLDLDWSLADDAVVTIGEGGDPLSNSTVDFAAGYSAYLHLVGETEGATLSEHFSKFTVNGAAPVQGSSLFVVTNGGTGSYIFTSDGLGSDIDGDGLSNGAELNTHFTEPGDADTDGDFIDDNRELSDGTSPTNPFDNNGEQGFIFIGSAAGGNGISLFLETNWTGDGDQSPPHINPPGGIIDANNPIPAIPGADENFVIISSGSADGDINFGPNLNLGVHELCVSSDTVLRGSATAGILGAGGAIIENDARVLVRFLSGLDVFLSDRASVVLYGGASTGSHLRNGTSIEFDSPFNEGAFVQFTDDDPDTVVMQGYTFSSVSLLPILFYPDFNGGTYVFENISKDSDSLPDGYERAFFGNLSTADDTTDTDGDGILDRVENELGTNPVAGEPAIMNVTPDLPGDVTLTIFAPSPFRDYYLFRSATLDDGFPTRIAGPIPGNAGLIDVADQSPLANEGYYRLESVAGGLHFDVDVFLLTIDDPQIGFCSMVSDTGSPTATKGPVVITAASGSNAKRISSGIADQPYERVLRDMLLRPAGDGPITVTISGLPAGNYRCTSFHHDWLVWNNSNPFDILVTDANGTDQLAVDAAVFTPAQLPYLGESFAVTSNGTDDMVLTIREDEAGTVDGVRFNGITIAPVP